jgi:hypothetical protein
LVAALVLPEEESESRVGYLQGLLVKRGIFQGHLNYSTIRLAGIKWSIPPFFTAAQRRWERKTVDKARRRTGFQDWLSTIRLLPVIAVYLDGCTSNLPVAVDRLSLNATLIMIYNIWTAGSIPNNRHITLVLLAYAFLVGIRVQDKSHLPANAPPEPAELSPPLLPLTTLQVRHLLARLIWPLPSQGG